MSQSYSRMVLAMTRPRCWIRSAVATANIELSPLLGPPTVCPSGPEPPVDSSPLSKLIFGVRSASAPTFIQDLPHVPNIYCLQDSQLQPDFVRSEFGLPGPDRVRNARSNPGSMLAIACRPV